MNSVMKLKMSIQFEAMLSEVFSVSTDIDNPMALSTVKTTPESCI